MKQHIKVWDYSGILEGDHLVNTEEPTGFEVDAWCVGGEEGILAYFYYQNKFCIANGDDGHWRLMYTCHKDWKNRIKSVMSEFILEE